MQRSLQEIKEYCSWNNIKYTIVPSKEYNFEKELPDFIEEKILIDLTDCIGGTKEGLMKYLRYE